MIDVETRESSLRVGEQKMAYNVFERGKVIENIGILRYPPCQKEKIKTP